jgi:hypothetical protein
VTPTTISFSAPASIRVLRMSMSSHQPAA